MNGLASTNQSLNNSIPEISLPKSLESFTVSTTSLQDQVQIAAPTSRQAVGAARITRLEADQRSFPPASDQLTRLVEDAKVRKEIPMCHRTADVRFVDGNWMAPTACKK